MTPFKMETPNSTWRTFDWIRMGKLSPVSRVNGRDQPSQLGISAQSDHRWEVLDAVCPDIHIELKNV
jgi:hypothetical protein